MAKKQQYRIRNWSQYNKSLVKRGHLTLWLEEESIQHWHQKPKTHGRRGRPTHYSDMAIQCMLTIKMLFHLPLRAAQGFVASVIDLLKLPIQAADYSTVCRRQKMLEPTLQVKPRSAEPRHVVIDSTGLKVFGEGEWKVRQHGHSKRRTWRKLHLAIDEKTGEILSAALTSHNVGDSEMLPDLLEPIDGPIDQVSADGAYDSHANYALLQKLGIKAIIPPRETAKIKQHGNYKESALQRDENIREIRKVGKAPWKKARGYHRRSLAETAMFRFKTLLDRELAARTFANQCTEAFIKCNIMNKMTHLGMPESYAVA